MGMMLILFRRSKKIMMEEIIVTGVICFAMTLVGISLGFALLKIQAG
ncbi:cytochrome b6-f complex subunit 7 (chloroplast) [Aureococcus anophagefferens]|jgi:hypothetical protein|uniref:Cytochrome b6-f complex subunit 7 n=2 Tax=Aureococcus anophagefferens TaxID=44056 RepID=A0ABR1G5G6_AURAN|nr:cytochrome b6-f complex subunit 7 [Aureococcus anophagefferens]KAH8043150.1 cytochrome b6-f complex subunit 7 [Aureococcus anophagefferens]KAH8043352.1 cytochrome b6-f complex subunit 7 [Aureococcus anophagefferens]